MKKEKKQEFTLRITRANKTQMIVILYDMVLVYLEDALEAFEQNDYKEYKWNIERGKDCIDELLNSLHMEYEIAGILRGLYFFYKRELTTAAVQMKQELISPVMHMLRELKESTPQAKKSMKSVLHEKTVFRSMSLFRKKLFRFVMNLA